MPIKDYKTISTKLGDDGFSKNFSNKRFAKDDILFETLGTLDEASTFLGLAYHQTNYENIQTIQATLQTIATLVATDADHPSYERIRKIDERDIVFLEKEEQSVLSSSPIDKRLYLPGSDASPRAAHFDVARTVCRRAERRLVQFINARKREDLACALKYVNRLSDLLFILARHF